MDDFEYGAALDRLRFSYLEVGYYTCKLDKMPTGKLTSMQESRLCDITQSVASTVTARYYKGIGSHKDNMVMVVDEC